VISTIDRIRGTTVESRHRVSAAVVDASGALVAWTGDPELVTFWRSGAKPVQAVPLLEDGAADALGITDAEIALACASHNGEPRHVEVAAGLLAKAGCGEADLACGPHPSLAPAVAHEMAARGELPRPIHSNCSGKHAAMLALARFHGWPIEGYRLPDHPVQRRIRETVARWTEVPAERLGEGTDGCGVVSFALPLRNMALAYARLAARADEDAGGPPSAAGGGAAATGRPPAAIGSVARIVRAMAAHPFLVAGTGRLCTEIAASSGGRVITKIGADGVYCALVRDRGYGVALKVEDGDVESARAAIVAVLEALAPGGVHVADSFRTPEVRNTLGEVVGRSSARIVLERSR
jgi:L-asparaginase II